MKLISLLKNKRLLFIVCLAIAIFIFFDIVQKKGEKSDKQIFTDIYLSNSWGGVGGSGSGSVEKNAIPYLHYLQNFINTANITSIVDIGCGDWELMKTINIPNHIQYLGVDIVDHVVARNQKKYSKPNVKFETVNTVEELPKYKGDLLIVKDVLQHWNKDQIFFAIKNIIPNFKYAIIVNSIDLPFRTDLNAKRGDTRTLDLKKPHSLWI